MNCHVCGKKLVAGHCLCGGCGKHLGNGITQTRLGRFVHHPEELAEVLIADAPWCKNLKECLELADAEGEIPDEKCKKCTLDWLMEEPKCE